MTPANFPECVARKVLALCKPDVAVEAAPTDATDVVLDPFPSTYDDPIGSDGKSMGVC